jgi:putative transposase
MLTSYKFRFYPNQQQIEFFNKSIGCSRFVWNNALGRNIEHYKESGKFIFYNQLAADLVELKQQHPWLREVNSQSLQKILRNFETTLKRSFSKSKTSRAGFPKFKSKHSASQSFSIPQHFEITGNQVKIPKLDQPIIFKKHREIKGLAKSMHVVHDIDRWYVVFNCELPNVPQKQITNYVGIDLGLKTFASTSDGEIIEYQHPIKLQNMIKMVQKALARKQKGSKNRTKCKTKLVKLHRKQAEKRKDFHNKIACSIAKANDLVVVEDLNIKGMVKNRKLARAISHQGWAQFVGILTNKVEQSGGTLVKINRFFPSSKMCSHCGWIKSDLELSDRTWTCDNCGSHHDRDLNAAQNIAAEGLRIVRQELPDVKRVENNTSGLDADLVQVLSMKHEAPVALATE